MKFKISTSILTLTLILLTSCIFFPSTQKDIWVLETETYYLNGDTIDYVVDHVLHGRGLTEYDPDTDEPIYKRTYDRHGNVIVLEAYGSGNDYVKITNKYQEYKSDIWVLKETSSNRGGFVELTNTYEISEDTLKNWNERSNYCSSFEILDEFGNVLHYYNLNALGDTTGHVEQEFDHLLADVYVRTSEIVYNIYGGSDIESYWVLDSLTLCVEFPSNGLLYPLEYYDERGLLIQSGGGWDGNGRRTEYSYQKLNN